MCWLVVKPANKVIPQDYVDTAQKINSDGYGIAWYTSTNALKVFKTLDYAKFKAKLATLTEFRAVVHLRAASVGKVTADNVHPFRIPTGVMFHNGTISSLRPSGAYSYKSKWATPACSAVDGCDDESDTLALAKLISKCKYKKLSDILPLVQHIITKTSNKLVFAEQNGTITIMNKSLGNEEGGIWYSNTYHIPVVPIKYPSYNNYSARTYPYVTHKETYTKPELVFVYGTLKKGLSNSHYLSKAKFIGNATTYHRWHMIGKDAPFPYLLKMVLPTESGHLIKGEVYEVPAESMPALDALEGVPTHYKKMSVSVEVGDTQMFVKTYVKATISPVDLEKEAIAEWLPTKRTYSTYTKPPGTFISRCKGVSLYTVDEINSLTHEALQDVYDSYWYVLYGSKPTSFLNRAYSSLLTSTLYLQGRMEAELDQALTDFQFESIEESHLDDLQTIKDKLNAAGYPPKLTNSASPSTIRDWHKATSPA